jgi:hypothetical protein
LRQCSHQDLWPVHFRYSYRAVCNATGLVVRCAPSSRSLLGQAPDVCASTVGAWVGWALVGQHVGV